MDVIGVWASGPGDVWFLSDDGVLRSDGTNLDLLTKEGPVIAAWGSGPGDVWLVGGIEQ
jgi:hypothetical protein